jgi:hypothetical protein
METEITVGNCTCGCGCMCADIPASDLMSFGAVYMGNINLKLS